MMDKEKYKEYKDLGAKCPYGRDAVVGKTRCINCHFNKLDSNQCYGDHEKVKRFMKRLQLDY